MEKPTQLVSPAISSQIALTKQYIVDHPKFSLSRAHAECRERKRYCDLLNIAQREYRETRQIGEAQRTFYDYLAMKVQDSLDKIGEAILK